MKSITTVTKTTTYFGVDDSPTPPKLRLQPRPLDERTDRPFNNLSEVHLAGKDGLALAFPVGSFWEVGPFTPGRDPQVVEVIGAPYTSGKNFSRQPEDNLARGQATWFIKTREVYAPGGRAAHGPSTGQPPHVLCELTLRMEKKASLNRDLRDIRIAELEHEIAVVSNRNAELHRQAAAARSEAEKAKNDFAEISRALYGANETLRKARTVALDQLRSNA